MNESFEENKNFIYIPKSLCLLSKTCQFDLSKEILKFIYLNIIQPSINNNKIEIIMNKLISAKFNTIVNF